MIDVEDFAIGAIEPEMLARLAHHGILGHAEKDDAGDYVRSVAVALIEAPIDRVAAVVDDIRKSSGGFLRDLNMVRKFHVLRDQGDRLQIRVDLRYRYFILSFGFHVIADLFVRGPGTLDLQAVGGKIKDLMIHFRLRPVDSERHTLFYCSLYYDIRSLGWLVDYFLKHHPEIELGVFSATAPVIAQALKENVEKSVRVPSKRKPASVENRGDFGDFSPQPIKKSPPATHDP